jgi:hypothetical protein
MTTSTLQSMRRRYWRGRVISGFAASISVENVRYGTVQYSRLAGRRGVVVCPHNRATNDKRGKENNHNNGHDDDPSSMNLTSAIQLGF